MAHASGLTCRQAQRLTHKLLDHRWSKPVPSSLQRHCQICVRCASWLALLDYEPIDLTPGPAADFADRVIAAAQKGEFVRPRSGRAVLFASAAAAVILIAVLGSFLLLPGTHSSNSTIISQRPVQDLLPVFLTVQREIDQFPERFQNVRAPSFDLLSAIPNVELQIPSDPLTGTIPSVKALGTTLQAAMEPIETPAREAYQKVKMIIDDPNVKKWLDGVAKGAM